jgi:hypothetical protein
MTKRICEIRDGDALRRSRLQATPGGEHHDRNSGSYEAAVSGNAHLRVLRYGFDRWCVRSRMYTPADAATGCTVEGAALSVGRTELDRAME